MEEFVEERAVSSITDEADTLKKFSNMCTTCIVGKACVECNMLSYDEESSFDRFDLLDPDFPTVMYDHDSYERPQHILMGMCEGNLTQEIVSVMGDMERSWTDRRICVKMEDKTTAKKLWEFVREDAPVLLDRIYGRIRSQECSTLGDQLFAT